MLGEKLKPKDQFSRVSRLNKVLFKLDTRKVSDDTIPSSNHLRNSTPSAHMVEYATTSLELTPANSVLEKDS